MNLGKKIVKIRKDNKMSQEDFAEILNVTRQTVSNWENSKNYPDIETLIQISDKFNISLDILLKGDKEMIKNIDMKVNNHNKLKTLVIVLSVILLVVISFIVGSKVYNNYKEQKLDEEYKEVLSNLQKLNFEHDENNMYFANIDGTQYALYANKIDLKNNKRIAAQYNSDNLKFIIDYYDGKVIINFINKKIKNELTKTGELKSGNSKLYDDNKETIVSITKKLIDLYDEIY